MRHFRRLRESPFSRPVRLVALAALLALTFTTGSIFDALGTPAPAVYSACVSPSTSRLPGSLNGTLPNGSLYNVTVNGTPNCQRGDTTITWNQQGPIGETGSTGPTGPTGPAGAPYTCDITNTYPGMNLSGCDLTNADLSNANLNGANLSAVTLNGANLILANFFEAEMTTASVEAAQWGNTNCPDSTDSQFNGGTCVGHLTP